MTKIVIQMASEYGIMLLYDSGFKPELPSGIGVSSASWNDRCIVFAVMSYVDGDATVTISDGANDNKLEVLSFSGKIICESRSISLYDTNDFAYVNVPLIDEFAQVTVRMSHERNPDFVECIIENMATF